MSKHINDFYEQAIGKKKAMEKAAIAKSLFMAKNKKIADIKKESENRRQERLDRDRESEIRRQKRLDGYMAAVAAKETKKRQEAAFRNKRT